MAASVAAAGGAWGPGLGGRGIFRREDEGIPGCLAGSD